MVAKNTVAKSMAIGSFATLLTKYRATATSGMRMNQTAEQASAMEVRVRGNAALFALHE
jgi:hypothetical protein